MRIRVLYIDDDIKTDLISDAEFDNIDLIPFESHEEGFNALMSDLSGFHAVVLDAKGKEHKSDLKLSLKGLKASRDKLIELNNSGHFIPYFIFTGQPDYMSNEMFLDSYGEFFIKGKDNQKLFDAIKKAVENKEEYIVQSEFKNIFEICNKHFDADTKKSLTRILLSLKKPNQVFDDELYFTQIRIILENLFRKANKYGFLDDKCIIQGKVNLTEASLYLAGEPTKYIGVRCAKSHFPKIIAAFVKDIIFITGAASHTTDPKVKDNIDLQNYRKSINTPYLLYSLTFKLLDVLIWFDAYLAENPNYEDNIFYWSTEGRLNLILGTVTKIAENGYGTFLPDNSPKTLSIIPSKIKELELFENQRIKVKTEEKGEKTYITHFEL